MVKGKREGEFKRYYNNSKSSIKTICSFKNDKLDGEYKEYDEDGNLIRDTVYIDGVENQTV